LGNAAGLGRQSTARLE